MIPLDDLISACAAEVLAHGSREALPGFTLDSRMVAPGDCFVATRGMHGDGHDYLEDAAEHGAAALLVESERLRAQLGAQPQLLDRLRWRGVSVLVVGDTRAALRAYARHIVARWRPLVVAVTGSTGKTTTKEAIADVLALRAPTFRSWRNFNDALGLPLALGRLTPEQRFAVVELGADHPGEIDNLCALLRPTIGVVTTVSAAHLRYFGSVAALAAELARLPAALPADGCAVLNGADPMARAMARQSAAPVAYFAPAAPDAPAGPTDADGRLAIVPLGSQQPLALTLRSVTDPAASPVVFAHLHGDHWAGAVLAALAVGARCGIGAAEALAALRDLEPLPGRMRWLAGRDDIVLLDDTHNATPASVAAGLAALDAIGRARGAPRVAVLGDLLHLGDAEAEAHAVAGALAATHADYVVTRGPRAEAIAAAAQAEGLPTARIAVTRTAEDAARAAEQFARAPAAPGTACAPAVVYLKGSEAVRMEQVTECLLADRAAASDLLDRQTSVWRRVVVTQPERPTWLEIDLAAIARNTRRVKELVGPGVAVLARLKADADGHGALRTARTVLRNGASWLGVASLNEAQPLRDAGIGAPMLVFGYTPPWLAREAVRLDLRATVYDAESARALAQAAGDLGRPARVHVKIDTGMARLGLRAEDVTAIVAFCELLRDLPGVEVEGIFTHFATADSADQSYARRQLARFEVVLRALEARGLRPPLVHAANSAALLALPEARYDLVRPGIALYGLSPSAEVRLPAGFAPALTFKTQISQVKEIPAGEGISYGATYTTSAPTRIAVLPVGYADGFRRAPRTWGYVLVRGQRAPLRGRVCMDQCMVDVTGIPGARMGDEVVLIGRQGGEELSAETVAQHLGTISYEVVAELLARVPRVS